MNNAGFWVRMMAYNIDFLFCLMIAFCLRLLITDVLFMYVLLILFCMLYEVAFTASKMSATPGKWYMGLCVVGEEGKALTLVSILFRSLLKFVSLVLLFVGFAMIAWRKDHRSLHDLITGSRVVFR